MAKFEGWLIKIGKQKFPHKYIAKDTYQSTPLQRTELKAYRDTQNKLHRVTSPNYKSKVTFQTIPLNLAQLRQIRELLNGAFSNSQQRKLQVTYWDDELMKYRTMTAYMPDTTYQVECISDNNIKYKAIELTFIEY